MINFQIIGLKKIKAGLGIFISKLAPNMPGGFFDLIIQRMDYRSQMAFRQQKDVWNNESWSKHKKDPKRRKGKKTGRGKKLLQDTGFLRMSTSYNSPGNICKKTIKELQYGTNVKYAAIHNFGGTVSWRTKKGSFEMPKRQFIGWNKEDDDYIQEVFDKLLRTGI